MKTRMSINNKHMKKEWFNGCIVNGLQFRLGGYVITKSGITYHICVKNICGYEIEIDNCVYYRFDGKRVRKKNEFGQYYLENGCTPYEEVWNYASFLDMQTKKLEYRGSLKPGKEYLVEIRWNGVKELSQDEEYSSGYRAKDILSEHDFSWVDLRIGNFVNMTIVSSSKEDDYAWCLSKKEVCQNYGRYVPVTSVPNTEDDRLTSLLSQDSQLENMYGIKISNANVHKNEDGCCGVVFELRSNGEDFCNNICVTACVYNRSEKPVLLKSIDICGFENFNVYAIEGLQLLPIEDISRIFVFPTKLA